MLYHWRSIRTRHRQLARWVLQWFRASAARLRSPPGDARRWSLGCADRRSIAVDAARRLSAHDGRGRNHRHLRHAIPHIELGIALSVLCLGLAIAFDWHPLEVISIGLIGIFALCHGYAHGVELPNAADPRAYAVGFVLATGLIHLTGIGIGSLSNIVAEGTLSHLVGVTIALAGIYFIVT
jgi:hypothetical protein